MKYDITKLQRFSFYARNNNKSVAWVHGQEKSKRITVVVVSGMKFVLVD